MNPTEHRAAAGQPSAAERAAAKFFDEILVPLAAAFRAKGRRWLDEAPPSADSYFSRPRRASMAPADFDLDLESDERFVDALMALWRKEEVSELDICRDDLIALVEGFRKEARDAAVDPDVSPFVYAMY